MISNRYAMVNRLSGILDNVIIAAFNDNFPIPTGTNEISMGNSIVSHKNGMYTVTLKTTGECLYSSIYLIETALLLSRYRQLNDARRIKTIMELENEYAKHYLDMQFYTHGYKAAKLNNDDNKAIILKDRYDASNYFASAAKARIRKFCDQIINKR